MGPFCGSLMTLFWTSGDVSCGFQSQSGRPYSSTYLQTCKQALVGLETGTYRAADKHYASSTSVNLNFARVCYFLRRRIHTAAERNLQLNVFKRTFPENIRSIFLSFNYLFCLQRSLFSEKPNSDDRISFLEKMASRICTKYNLNSVKTTFSIRDENDGFTFDIYLNTFLSATKKGKKSARLQKAKFTGAVGAKHDLFNTILP